MYMGYWEPGEDRPSRISRDKEREYYARFRGKEPGFYYDTEWWKLVEQADKRPLDHLKECPDCAFQSLDSAEICTGCGHIFIGKEGAFCKSAKRKWRCHLAQGFPNAVLEAAATGIPVITTLCTGSRDSVVPEVTGLLIPPGYPEAISEAVLKLLRDPVRRHRMGEAARAWVIEHFVDERVLGLAAAFYKNMLSPTAQEIEAQRVRALIPAQH